VQNSGMRLRVSLALAALAACHTGPPPEAAPPAVAQPAPRAAPPALPDSSSSVATPRRSPAPLVAPDWPLFTRVVPIVAAHGAVVSSHPIASSIGLGVLARGGNAVDAAVAVAFALAVVHPVAGNIGGGGFMLIRTPDGVVRALDFRETAPQAARPGMFVDSAGTPLASSVTGALSVGVPGSVAGLVEAHERYGHLPWRGLLAAAESLARTGYTIDGARSHMVALEAARLSLFPASRAQFLPDDQPPPPGSRVRQPELARTLALLADSGAAPFYRGGIATLIEQEMQRDRGLVTAEDLAHYRPVWREPLKITYRGDTIYTMPPPSGGGVALAEILNVMEGYASLPPFGSAALMQLQIEAMRRAYVDRNAYLGDPAFVAMPLDRLLSKAYAAERRAEIEPGHATPTPRTPGTRSEGTETTHFSVVDSLGNAVACTMTLNNDFGSAVTVGGAGFLLNDEMDDFTIAPGRPNLYGLVQGAPNTIAPGKRMLSAMTPTMVVDPTGRLLLVLGSPGGSRITTAVYEVLTNMIDGHMSLADAIGAPRLHHQGLPDIVSLERDGFLPAVVDSLTAMGYTTTTWGYKTEVNAIARTDRGWVGVADPRRSGGAAAY
jgi:gamma-glutamyltranspeptidase/glutathione hydrolase